MSGYYQQNLLACFALLCSASGYKSSFCRAANTPLGAKARLMLCSTSLLGKTRTVVKYFFNLRGLIGSWISNRVSENTVGPKTDDEVFWGTMNQNVSQRNLLEIFSNPNPSHYSDSVEFCIKDEMPLSDSESVEL